MFNCTGIQQIRESAQVSIDSALGRAQSALNEGVATRLDALRLETELEDLQGRGAACGRETAESRFDLWEGIGPANNGQVSV